MTHDAPKGSILQQPRAVWAVAFAAVIAFMGIGLVDPILPAIARRAERHAEPGRAAVHQLHGRHRASRCWSPAGSPAGSAPSARCCSGSRSIVVFAALAGASAASAQIVGFRAGWGLGNALFIATALATIVGAASGGVASAIILYEAALGLGIATGPLLGGLLGGISWRGPFFGTAALMAIGFVAILVLLPKTPDAARARALADPFRALRHRGLLTMALTALFYNFGFFTLLAYTPFPLDMAAHRLGLVFFGWGLCARDHLGVRRAAAAGRFGTLPTIRAVLGLFASIWS